MSDENEKTANLKLENNCTIYEIAQLHHDLVEMLQKSVDITIDTSDVKNVDASFLQFFISIQAEAKKGKTKFNVVGDSVVVNELVNNMYCQSVIDSDAA